MLTGRLCVAALIGAAAITSTPTFAQDKITLKFLTGWDDRFEGTPFIAKRFATMVTEATKGRITFQFSGPEVVKPRQQFQPTSAGVFPSTRPTPPTTSTVRATSINGAKGRKAWHSTSQTTRASRS